jgi:hypothetical protein
MNKPHSLMSHPYEQMTQEQIATSKKVYAARANAQKSTGPRTPEGKAISARNAFKHGFAAAKLTIDETEDEAFHDHLDAYFLRFKPQDQVEADAVRRIAEAQWKMDIVNATENAIMSLESGFQMCLADAKLDPSQITLHHYRAFAIIEQSEGRALDLCHRYYVSASRQYDRSLKTFYRLRDERLNDAREQPVPDLVSSSSTSADPQSNQTPVKPDSSPEPVKKPNEPKTRVHPTPDQPSIIEFPNEPNCVVAEDAPDRKRAA